MSAAAASRTKVEPLTVTPQYEAVIVGTGFGGMGAAIQLLRDGLQNILMLDRNDDLGGTWHVNHYPGLAVDIASLTYSYSFEPNPYWSRLYARSPELKRYAAHARHPRDRDLCRQGHPHC